MTQQTEPVSNPKIFSAMAAILKDFGYVGKDKKNDHFGYKFRGVDDALFHAHPLLAKHGVFVLLSNMSAEFSSAPKENVRCIVKATVRFVADDGSYVEASLVGEGMDKGDKALMKAQANGLKYVFWYTFCVPTDEPKDSEAFPEPTEEEKPKLKVERAVKSKKDMAVTVTTVNPTNNNDVVTLSWLDIYPYLKSVNNAKSPEELDGIVTLIKDKAKGLEPAVRKQLVDAIKQKRVDLA